MEFSFELFVMFLATTGEVRDIESDLNSGERASSPPPGVAQPCNATASTATGANHEWGMSAIDTQGLPTFEGRTLPVEAQVALKCAALHVPNRCKKRDSFIAATAMVRGMTVVTRDVTDFASTGATMFNS